MKFVHIADLHFDSPFTTLNRIENLSNIRRLEQREALRNVIEYIKENNIEYLFIAGDLYEHEYVRQSTIEYINNLFKEVPNTKIFIVPGNHDPYLINSYYSKYSWSDNVHIFDGKISKISLKECDIYGVGFEDFYCKNSMIENIKIEDNEKINILITHGSLDASEKNEEDYFNYNPIKNTKLKELNFDYVALGHIHKNNFSKDGRIIYPGSLISFGFDELGKHGMVVGEISKDNITLEFKVIDNREFINQQINVNEILSEEELVEKINMIQQLKSELYKIILVGNKNFEIDVNHISKLIQNDCIIKIKDETKVKYDLNEISNEYDLRGIFVKLMLEKMKNTESKEEKEIIKKAIEIGIDALEG